MDYELMQKLSEACAIPGSEREVADIMRKGLKASGFTVRESLMGDIIGEKKGKGPKIMLAAHMDEIGLAVRSIDEKGFVRFMKIGGIDDRVLPNQRVAVMTSKGKVPGVIGSKPPHIQEDNEHKGVMKGKSLFIDIGASGKKEAEKLGISIGDPITFQSPFTRLAGDRFSGKALDNRIGCYIILELAKRLRNSNANLLLVGSTQEEVSFMGKGARITAYAEEPDFFIAVDTTVATDHPECGSVQDEIKLGKGPAIVLLEGRGSGNISDRRLVQWLIGACKKGKIPYQLEAVEGGFTDASEVHNVRSGIASISVGVATRYIHSNVSIGSAKDVELTTKLLEAAIRSGAP
jgi:endoglucanase